MEPDLLPYQTALPQAQAVLVLAPHPDDEVFGCGGTLHQMHAAGTRVIEIVLTSGDLAGDAGVREAESSAASAVMGLEAPRFWRLPDRGVVVSAELIARVAEVVVAHHVDLVLAPSPWEVHPDHRATCQLALELVRGASSTLRLGFYEVGVPLRPNCLCDITACVPLKRQAMDCFASQMQLQDYGDQVLALNRFRSYTLGQGVTHAEAFWFPSMSDAREVWNRQAMDWVSPGNVTAAVPRLPTDATGVPVTVVVPQATGDTSALALGRLLDSISLQTYRSLEVWLLGDPPSVSVDWLGCPVRSVDFKAGPSRPVGYVLFAWPGDWMLPDHIARLADVLNRLPQTVAARTSISCRPAPSEVMSPSGAQVPAVSVMWRARDGDWFDQVGGAPLLDAKWLHAQGPVAELEGQSAWTGCVVPHAVAPTGGWAGIVTRLKRWIGRS